MGTALLTENDVKQKLGIKDFRRINKNQLIQFVSAIPDMDREVAIACVNQFPHFKEYSLAIIDHYYALCDKAINNDGKEAIEAYQIILDELRNLLNNRKLRKQERQYIIEKMIDIGSRIEIVEDKKRGFAKHVLHTVAGVAIIGIGAAGTLLGSRINLSDIVNRLKND